MDGLHRRALLSAMITCGAAPAVSRAFASSPPALNANDAYKLAVEAYIYSFPLVYFGRYRHKNLVVGDEMTGMRQRPNSWTHFNRVVTPDVIGAPQTDTLYSMLWADLSVEPLLLRVPKMDGRYWSIQCCDFFGVTYGLPNRRKVTKESLIALVGPNWTGSLPSDVDHVFRAAMPWTFNVLRMHFVSDEDRANAVRLQAQFTATPLSAHVARAPWQAVPADVFAPAARANDPLADFKLIQRMWRECPPPQADRAYTELFAAIGLRPGRDDGLDALPDTIKAALARAEADGLKQIMATTRQMPGGLSANGWTLPRPQIGLYADRDFLYRAAIAQLGTIGTPTSENVYMMLQRDGAGAMLTGDGRYELRYDADNLPEVDAFWSLHAYRYTNFTVIPNPLNRYSISNRSPNLRYAADGSLTIYLQADDPGGDKSANWIPIVLPAAPFFLLTRAYEPRGKMAELKWSGPKLTRVA